jgi:hypothetical protein
MLMTIDNKKSPIVTATGQVKNCLFDYFKTLKCCKDKTLIVIKDKI